MTEYSLYVFTVMEIQKVLMLLAASWLCCGAIDEKTELFIVLLADYEKDAEPPLAHSETNTTVAMTLIVLCAAHVPDNDAVSIESWIRMVSVVAEV